MTQQINMSLKYGLTRPRANKKLIISGTRISLSWLSRELI